MTAQIFQTYARYNAWMNENVYTGCAKIPDTQRKADMGAFFKSIHGTLNHILVGDTIWLARFQGAQLPPYALNTIVYEDFDDLWAARRKLDGEIKAFAAGLTDDWLAKPFTFKSMSYNREITGDMWLFVMQLFNHQTHHRGQVTTLMKQCGVDPGPTDLPVMPA
ncbi:MAG: damage-inducible protein DinB [Rhodospirillaceae bacterium]|nr:damage-inducible protein DinB [Rhodospirillaceae bacterium]